MICFKTYGNDPKLKEDIEGVKKSLNRLRAIIEKLYNILQHDLNKINITPEKTKIYEFLERIYEDFQPLMDEKKIQFMLQNKFQRESIASIDPVYMRQLMQNLLTNAIKFTPLKGKITISGKEDRKHFFIYVADSGEGVPDETKEEIFEKFKTNHTMQSPGLGLGLYICKKIAELHKGKIWVEDNKGRGAIFCFQIPKISHKSSKTGQKLRLSAKANAF